MSEQKKQEIIILRVVDPLPHGPEFYDTEGHLIGAEFSEEISREEMLRRYPMAKVSIAS